MEICQFQQNRKNTGRCNKTARTKTDSRGQKKHQPALVFIRQWYKSTLGDISKWKAWHKQRRAWNLASFALKTKCLPIIFLLQCLIKCKSDSFWNWLISKGGRSLPAGAVRSLLPVLLLCTDLCSYCCSVIHLFNWDKLKEPVFLSHFPFLLHPSVYTFLRA